MGRTEREKPKLQSPDPRPSPGTPAGGRVRPAWLLVTGKAAEAASAPMLATGAEAPRQPPHGHSANASQYLGAHRVSGAPPFQRVSRNLYDDTRRYQGHLGSCLGPVAVTGHSGAPQVFETPQPRATEAPVTGS